MSKPDFIALFDLTELSEWVVEFSICGTILLVVLGLLSLLCKRSSASARHAVWVSGLAMLLLLPFSLKLLPRLHVLPGLGKPAAEGAITSRGGVPSLTQSPPQDSFDSAQRRRYAEGASLTALPLKATDFEVSDPDRVPPKRSQSNSIASISSATSYEGSLNFTKILALTWLAGAAFCMLRLLTSLVWLQVTTMGDDASMYARYDYPRLGQINIPADIEELDLEPFLLTPKQIVRGRLYDGARRPIGGATVIFHTVDRMLLSAEAVTEADGGFVTPIGDWAIIQGDPQIAQRYRWSILHDDKAEGGYRKRTTTPLNVTSNEAGELMLERP